jgi:hypothetical protein
VRLRNVTGASLTTRLKQWKSSLRQSKHNKLPAKQLYVGEYWSVIRQLPELCASKFDTKLYVCSAGYGFISADTKIANYSATFASKHDDSVTTRAEPKYASNTRRAWWKGMTGTKFTKLVERSPDAHVLVIASPDYLDAMASDLNDIRLVLKNSEQLVIVSSRLPSVLKDVMRTNLVASVAKLELSNGIRGGTRSSLHARTARHLLTSVTPKTFLASKLRVKYQNKVNRITEPLPTFDRERHDREDIKEFIRDELKKERKGESKNQHSHTSLLRVLRDVKWWACEQHRFARYFEEVKNEASLFPMNTPSQSHKQTHRS